MNQREKNILTRIGGVLPDKAYLSLRYWYVFRRRMNWKHPQTFSEKLQWLKLYDRRPEYTTMVDKYAVKDYVAGIIGRQYVIPTIGVWDSPDDIEWERLPQRFVLKTTHGGGSNGVLVVKDKEALDRRKAVRMLRESMRADLFLQGREWPYKNVRRRVIAEEFVEGEGGELKDYKFFCFDGEVKALFVATERGREGTDVKFDFFDAEFCHLALKHGHENAGVTPPKPRCFEEMKELAAKLSKGIPTVRIDLYEVGGRAYFGEITFYHHSGFMPFEPEEWDRVFGDWVRLPGRDEGHSSEA